MEYHKIDRKNVSEEDKIILDLIDNFTTCLSNYNKKLYIEKKINDADMLQVITNAVTSFAGIVIRTMYNKFKDELDMSLYCQDVINHLNLYLTQDK